MSASLDVNKLSYLYGLSPDDIIKHQKYLNFKTNEFCCYHEPEPFVETEEGQYSKPIEHLIEYYKNVDTIDYFSSMLPLSEKMEQNNKPIIYDTTDDNCELNDYIIRQYIANRPDTFMITIWPVATRFISDIVSFLGKEGIVSAVKKVPMSYKCAENLLEQLYNKIIIRKQGNERKMKFITSKLQYIGFAKDTTSEVITIVFDNINKHELGGTGSPLKTELRQHIYNMIKKDDMYSNVELADIIHINDYFYETIEYSQIYFHQNTLDMMEQKNLINWLSDEFNSSKMRIQAVKNWQIQNLSTMESERLVLMTGSTFATLGIRKSSDVDGMMISIKNNSNAEKKLEKLVCRELFNETTKLPIMDFGMPDTTAWKDSWTVSNNLFYGMYEPPINDFVIAFKHCYYWNGLKVINLNSMLKMKMSRYIPSDYSDFIVLERLYPHLIENEGVVIEKNAIWSRKKYRDKNKINELIRKSMKRYLKKDQQKININPFLL
jgi:hypothetical protein